jgi:RND superfamily putative drug exporter
MFETLASFAYRHARAILIATGLFLVAAIVIVVQGGRLTGGAVEGTEAPRAEGLAERVSGSLGDTTSIIVFSFPRVDPAVALPKIERALEPVRRNPAVRLLVTPGSAPAPLAPRMVNAQQHAAYALLTLRGDFVDAVREFAAVRKSIVVEDGITVALTGKVPFQHDLNKMLEKDLLRAELIALPVALLVLLLVFQTVVAAVLPVAVGALAVLGGLAIVLLLSHIISIASYTINVASLIGLGVAIDYSLFTVNRYREELAAGNDHRTALIRTMQTAGRVVAFSGLAVAAALCGLFFFRGSYLASMGLGGAIVVGLAVLFAMTFLPALLAVLGPKIHAGRLPRLGWKVRLRLHHSLDWVLAHPWRVLIATTTLLLVMGLPFLRLRTASVDATVLPPSAEARRGQQMLHDAFPDLARTRFVVAVEFPTPPALNADRVGALYDLSRRIRAIPGVVNVESIVDAPIPLSREMYQRMLLAPPSPQTAAIEAGKALTVRDRYVLLYALSDLPPASDAARNIVTEIRSQREVADGRLLVGGQTASDIDTIDFVTARVPYAVAFVVCVMLVVLYIALRSVVLPIEAVLLNFVSISASFGALVWVFQEGHLFVAEPRPTDPSVPILLFCIVFGLSMDYHVLMLSRIREAYLQHRDNTRAVAEGLARSAGVITAAAAIMVTVFGAFSLAHFIVIRSVGFGLALAIALDATIVRLLLVPASMKLLGKWNWWRPHLHPRPPGTGHRRWHRAHDHHAPQTR